MYLRALLFSFLVAFSGLVAEIKQVYFSPQDGIADHLIERIDQEKERIYVAIYACTHRGVLNALVRAQRRGVDVSVLIDPFTLNSKPATGILKHTKMDVTVFDPEKVAASKANRTAHRRPLMHNKFCVFGEKTVWTGSFNFTYDATNAHRENVVVIEDQEIANKYIAQFLEIKRVASRPLKEVQMPAKHSSNGVLDLIMGKR